MRRNATRWTRCTQTIITLICVGVVFPAVTLQATVQEDFENYLRHFTQYPTRMVGSPENAECAAFIEQEFRAMGLEDITVEEFESVVPLDKGGTLTVLGSDASYRLYCLWPNLVRTSTLPKEGIRGEMIYAGKGDYADYNGKVIQGSIVLMDFGSGNNFIKARSLGAQAIVFFDNGYVNYSQAVAKFLEVPADIPRFWIEPEDARQILDTLESAPMNVHLQARMEFEQVQTWNIYGFRYSRFPNLLVTMDRGTNRRVINSLRAEDKDSGKSVLSLDDGKTVAEVLNTLGLQSASNVVLTFDKDTQEWLQDQSVEDVNCLLIEDSVLRGLILKGTEAWKLIALNGFYDSSSIVPLLAPGAESACSISSLLALGKHLDPSDTDYSLMFFASGNHYGGLRGTSEFLYWHTRSKKEFAREVTPQQNIPIQLFVSLDLSSANDQVATTAMGCYFYGWLHRRIWDINKNKLASYARLFDEFLDRRPEWKTEDPEDPIRRHVNAVNPPRRMWPSFFGTMLAFESEIAAHMGLDAITFFTPFDARTRSFTPHDTLERMNVPNATRQVETISYLLSELLKTENVFPDVKFMVDDYGRDVLGKVYEFDRKKRFVPEDKIPGALVTYRHADDWMRHIRDVAGVKTDQMLFSSVVDATPGLQKETVEPGDFYIRNFMVVDGNLQPGPGIRFAGYVLDDEGDIVMMPDLGQDGARSYPLGTGTSNDINRTMVMLFPCRTMALYDIIDSRYLRALDVFDIKTAYDAEPIRYGKADHPWQFHRPKDIEPVIVVAAEPDERLKILGSTGPYGVKYLLTNAPEQLLINPVAEDEITEEIEEASRGTGYPLTPSLDYCAYKAARDMWIVDDIRIKSFTRYGIRNERLVALHDQARDALLQAKEFLEAQQYDSFMSAVQRAWGLEARGYPDVKATMNDTVSGVLFYFAILIPFAVFMERLVFGFPDIRKRVAGFAFFLLLIFLILRQVHPAFELSSSPYVIFLAFIIMMLAGIVLSIIVAKFGNEIRKMKAAGTGVSDVDVGRLSAAKAAVFIGISNLRKRKMRTIITALTVTLLTFTVQSFTSVRSTMRFYKIPVSDTPSYQGGMIRDLNWASLQECTLDYLKGAFAHCAKVIPRSFNAIRSQGQMEYFRVQNTQNNRSTLAFGLVGLTPEEIHAIDYPSTFIGNSRWFQTVNERSCILPDTMAALLGLSESDIGRASVNIMGQQFQLCGILDAEQYNLLRDLDDEKTTPLDTVAQMSEARQAMDTSDVGKTALKLESFWHIDADNTVILPFDWVMDHGGVLQSIAITDFHQQDGTPIADFVPIVEDFMLRIATTMFVGHHNSVKVYSSIGQTSFTGIGKLLVPIAIAALIVLNTMMGSVHERRKEISVYSSVGLAPTHIGALFVAESAVFATVGAVLGYLLGQVVMRILTEFGWLSGLELNYSSISAVYSTLIVMIVVFLSSLYPARLASSMAVPDVTRKWKFPDPEGDRWHFDFPFTVRGSDALPMCVYLVRYFEAYTESSLGAFFTRDVRLSGTQGDEPHYTIEMTVCLAPFDLGVSQRVRLEAFSTGEYGIYKIVITINRESGQFTTWQRMNRGFLNTLRKRCLVWRTITPAQKEKYREEGLEMMEHSAAAVADKRVTR